MSLFHQVASHRRLRDGLALLAGLSHPYAYAPYDHWWLGLISLAVLLFLWVREPKRAWWYGWVFGAGAFTLGLSWLYVSIHEVGMAPIPLAAGLTLLFGVSLGLFPAAAGWVLRWFTGWSTAWLLAMAVAAWTLLSWSRSWLFSGFPWLSPGAVFLDTPLQGYGPLFGEYGMEWMAMATAALLMYPAAASKQAGRAAKAWAVGGVLLIWLGGALLQSVSWTHPVGEKIRVSLVQGNVEQRQKWRQTRLEETLALYRDLTEPQWGQDLIMWPETAVPAFLHQVKREFVEPLDRRAAEAGSALVIGVPVLEQSGDYYNAVVALGAGEGQYRKRHLVPFGEYLPFEPVLRPIIDMIEIPMSDFSPGAADQPGLSIKGVGMAMSICYEDIFGAEYAATVGESGLLANVSNDAWFGDTAAPHQHHQMARLRALETGRPMIRVSNTGLTGFINEKGGLGGFLPLFQPGVLRGEVQPHEGATPYLYWRDGPVALFAGLLLLLGVGRRVMGFGR